MTAATSLGTLLKAHRNARGFTAEHLADLAGVSDTLILHVEKGTRNLGYGNALSIAAALELDEPQRSVFMAAREATGVQLSKKKLTRPDPVTEQRLGDVEARLERIELSVMVLLQERGNVGEHPPDLDPPR